MDWTRNFGRATVEPFEVFFEVCFDARKQFQARVDVRPRAARHATELGHKCACGLAGDETDHEPRAPFLEWNWRLVRRTIAVRTWDRMRYYHDLGNQAVELNVEPGRHGHEQAPEQPRDLIHELENLQPLPSVNRLTLHGWPPCLWRPTIAEKRRN